MPLYKQNDIVKLTVDICETRETDFYQTSALSYLIRGIHGIVCRNTSTKAISVPIRFFDYIAGHDCEGAAPDGWGQNIQPKYLEKVVLPYECGSRVCIVDEFNINDLPLYFNIRDKGVVARMPLYNDPHVHVMINGVRTSVRITQIIPDKGVVNDVDSFLIP